MCVVKAQVWFVCAAMCKGALLDSMLLSEQGPALTRERCWASNCMLLRLLRACPSSSSQALWHSWTASACGRVVAALPVSGLQLRLHRPKQDKGTWRWAIPLLTLPLCVLLADELLPNITQTTIQL